VSAYSPKKSTQTLNLTGTRSTAPRKKKKRRPINILYWVLVIFLTSWMLYLNLNVFFEYREVQSKYQQVSEEYENRKQILEQKLNEYQRLKQRLQEMDENDDPTP